MIWWVIFLPIALCYEFSSPSGTPKFLAVPWRIHGRDPSIPAISPSIEVQSPNELVPYLPRNFFVENQAPKVSIRSRHGISPSMSTSPRGMPPMSQEESPNVRGIPSVSPSTSNGKSLKHPVNSGVHGSIPIFHKIKSPITSPKRRSNHDIPPKGSVPFAPTTSRQINPQRSTPIVSFSMPPSKMSFKNPVSAPLPSHHNNHARKRYRAPFPPYSNHQGPMISISPLHSPTPLPKRKSYRPHSPSLGLDPSWPPSRSSPFPDRHAFSPLHSLPVPSKPIGSSMRAPSPIILPLRPVPWISVPIPMHPLLPPSPNHDCEAVTCKEPLTNAPSGSPCGCVRPIKVALRLDVALYTFFPLVSELVQDIAISAFLKQSQVRVMGANAAFQQQEKTIALIDLVPLGDKFDNTIAFWIFEKFWHKKITINVTFFGDYEVLYVHYPGLPSSLLAPIIDGATDAGQYAGDTNGRVIRPLGVDVRKHKEKTDKGIVVVIILTSVIAFSIFVGISWLLLLNYRVRCDEHVQSPRTSALAIAKHPGIGSMTFGSGPSSVSMSFSSSFAAYTGCAKTFTTSEIEKATDNFHPLKVLGEGGFGCVYKGRFEDGIEVAVKVLKREDQQGGREFLSEVEMLSRLHHRNLVKLIGICTEEHTRCLVYELIPNGSLESYLHGADKEKFPLDWNARVKIALGSARGLAYLHEDSSPRVIHRDFKSSNILLEYDYTPKVSDFGLARTALEEGNEHISTRIMGTFGYVAPEYAMTGHLLVKSDVYSFGVVLLELLTGRKPVDVSQPQGQENLVTWARPILTNKDKLKTIIDPALGYDLPIESIAKVAAIASMCIQPEVSHRPFMGEVVQALKLVASETDEKNGELESLSIDESSVKETETKMSNSSSQILDVHSYVTIDYDAVTESERESSRSDVFNRRGRFPRQMSDSFRRQSSFGAFSSIRSNTRFWQRIWRMSGSSGSR